MIKNLVLIALITFSLSACSTLEVVHAPVGCEGQPKVSIGLTQAEYDDTSKAVIDKVVVFAKTLRARIDAQCKINYEHDKIHGTEK